MKLHVAMSSVMLVACEPIVPIGSALPVPVAANPNAIDILFVIDNSASMGEEQEALARSFLTANCPVQDLENVPDVLADAEPLLLEALGESCGFAQILAASEKDFQIGVITTDVNACDNIFFTGDHKPQRGCLQPAPGSGKKVLRRGDENLVDDFVALVTAVGTLGSPIERGFDATLAFLQNDIADPSCAGDRDALIRPEAQLLIIYVTDEDDCSHPEDSSTFTNRSDVCDQDFFWFNAYDAEACYRDAELLAPVSEYAARFIAQKGAGREQDVRVALIGGVQVRSDGAVAGACRLIDDEISDACIESHGNSHRTEPNEPCDATNEIPCCTADPATRYVELSRALNGPIADPICRESFSGGLAKALARTIQPAP
jgi:hypothetical protein